MAKSKESGKQLKRSTILMLLCGAILVALPWLLNRSNWDKSWDKPAVVPLWKVKAYRFEASNLAFSQDGARLLSLSEGPLLGWNAQVGQPLKQKSNIPVVGNRVLSPKGGFLVVVRLERLTARRTAQKLLNYYNSVSNDTGKVLDNVVTEVATGDGFDLYDTVTGKRRFFATSPKSGRTLSCLSSSRNSISNTIVFSADERRVCAITEYSIVGEIETPAVRSEARMWDVKTGQLLRQTSVKLGDFDESAYHGLYAFSADAQHFYQTVSPSRKDDVGSTGSLILRDVFGTEKYEFGGRKSEQVRNIWTHPTFSPRGRYLACIYDNAHPGYRNDGEDGSIYIWDLKTRSLLWKTNIAGFKPNVLAFSPDEMQLAIGGDDFNRTIGNYSIAGKLILLAVAQSNQLIEYSNESESDRFAQKKIRLQQKIRQSPSQIRFMPGDSGWVSSLAFSPDGTKLAAGYCSGKIKMWRVSQ